MVTFVALLMFLQLGASGARATFFAALLFLPWVLKSFLRSWVRRIGSYRQMLHIIEWLLFGALMAVALSFPYGIGWVFTSLFTTSILCAWHELTARMYYERMLYPKFQRLWMIHKTISSQVAVIVTYGALIMLVSSLQVFFRNYRAAITSAWSMGCYITSGIFLAFVLYHMFVLRSPNIGDQTSRHSMSGSVMAEVHVIERIRRQPKWWVPVLSLFILLLPQSMMFLTRVLYLYDKASNGALECTMQEIGFAQGTIGVIAFCMGIMLGRSIMQRYDVCHFFWPLVASLGLSPAVYLAMTFAPPTELWQLSICTFMAQLLFGLGICVCRVPVQRISGERYRNTINLLYIPLVALCMIIPMALSGCMADLLGYRAFFAIDTLSAPIGWSIVWLLNRQATTSNG